MMAITELPRNVQKVWKSKPTLEGAGVHLNRVFGFNEIPQLDPFLLLDVFHSDRPSDYERGFPWHPHRGIETITYVLDGEVEHGDSMGNRGLISAGDVQWMTAGSGIIHQEMPKGNSRGEMWGFQLWANLPANNKMMNPRYQEVKSGQIPQVTTPEGATVRIISGEVSGTRGPVGEIVIEPEFLDVSLPADKSFRHPVKESHTAFAYIVEGEGYFDPDHGPSAPDPQTGAYGEGTLVLYGPGTSIAVAAGGKSVRFLLVSGKPLRETIAWYGPVVMNTRDELRLAFDEYERGTFVKHPR